jgi:hypothetical protein
MGGKYHLKLNTGERPIANKYREGKMKRTLKRELKVREIVKRETLETSLALMYPNQSGDSVYDHFKQVSIGLCGSINPRECTASAGYSPRCCFGIDRGMQCSLGELSAG